MLLVARKASTTGAKAQGDFPTAGRGWKNHCTWGPGSNRGSAGATDDIRRWMVKVMLTHLGTPDSWKRRLTGLLIKDDARESAALASLRKSATTALRTRMFKLG